MQGSRIDILNQLLQKSPDDAFLHHALALEYVKLGNESEARRCFERNKTSAPEYVATYYHLGKLIERSGNNAGAMHIYEEGMRIAKAAGDNHTYNELQAAYEDLAY